MFPLYFVIADTYFSINEICIHYIYIFLRDFIFYVFIYTHAIIISDSEYSYILINTRRELLGCMKRDNIPAPLLTVPRFESMSFVVNILACKLKIVNNRN